MALCGRQFISQVFVLSHASNSLQSQYLKIFILISLVDFIFLLSPTTSSTPSNRSSLKNSELSNNDSEEGSLIFPLSSESWLSKNSLESFHFGSFFSIIKLFLPEKQRLNHFMRVRIRIFSILGIWLLGELSIGGPRIRVLTDKKF